MQVGTHRHTVYTHTHTKQKHKPATENNTSEPPRRIKPSACACTGLWGPTHACMRA